MTISGFTMVRNATKLYYPIKQAISSILPICDEFVVAGLSDGFVKPHQSLGLGKREGPKDDGADNRKDGGGRSDAQRETENRHHTRQALSAEKTRRENRIVLQVGPEGGTTLLAGKGFVDHNTLLMCALAIAEANSSNSASRDAWGADSVFIAPACSAVNGCSSA